MKRKWLIALFISGGIALLVGFASGGNATKKSGDVSAKDKITYYFDPLCGWCYAFSSVIDSLQQVYGDDIHFEVVPGGMVVGNKVGPVSNISKFLLNAIPGVEKMTGAKFGVPFIQNLQEGSMVFNSTPPSLAVIAFKGRQPKNQIAYAAAVQKKIYYDGGAPVDISIYSSLAREFGEDSVEFDNILKSATLQKQVQESFQRSRAAGVNGFPTVIYSSENKKEVLTRGYTDYSTIEKRLLRYLK